MLLESCAFDAGQSWPGSTGSNPTAENLASELWQFRLPRFASIFRRRH